MDHSFSYESFARQLLAEALFYDAEYGAVGTASLVDPGTERERYIAFFFPEEGVFVLEEGTAWEDEEAGKEIGYALATGSEEHSRYALPEEAADTLLALAREHDLLPSVATFFEEEID